MNIKPYKRTERFGHELKRILGDILIREVDSSKIGFVTISDVKVARDLKSANVYFSVINSSESKEKAEKFFRNNNKFIKGILGRSIRAKSIPDLKFFYDDTYQQAEKIDRLISNLHKSDKGSS